MTSMTRRSDGRNEAGRGDPPGKAGGAVPVVLHETLGLAWMTPDLFRFGASTLLNDVLMQIRKQRTGRTSPWTTSRSTEMTDVEKRPDRAPAPLEWDYAPAPEARDIVRFEERYGLFIGGEEVEPRSGEWFPTVSPATEEPLAEVAQAGPEDVDPRSRRPATPTRTAGQELAPSERAKYLFRIARILQERSRELAVAESLDGGKPISRVAGRRPAARGRAFLLLRRLGGQARVRLEPAAAAARGGRPDHSLELPPADACVEGRARVGLWQHGRAQAGRDDAPHRASLHRRLPAG